MELRVLLLLLLCFPGLHAQKTVAEESRPEGSTFSLQCPYTAQVGRQNQKAWCRDREGQCEIVVQTTNPTRDWYPKQATNGKVTIEDNPKLRMVSISMTNLQAEDSGTYYCAYITEVPWYQPLKTIMLQVYKEVQKDELDSLSVPIKYDNLVSSMDRITWCRREGETECVPLVTRQLYEIRRNSRVTEDRVWIQDDYWERTVTITMQKLQAQDTGVYLFALYRASHYFTNLEVRLSVSKRTQQHTAKELGSVSVQCPYSAPDYGALSKAWCKVGDRETCTTLISTDSRPSRNRQKPQQGRVMIWDDTQQGIVTITMEKLQAHDSGMYWCVLNDPRRVFRMVEVTLSVLKEVPGTILPDTAGTSHTTPTASTSAPSFSSNVNTFILLSVVLSLLFILVLISLITLCVRRYKQLKRRGTRQAEDIYDIPEDTAQLGSTERMESPKVDSKDLDYVTLNFKSRLSPEDPVYCNVESSQTHRKPKDENVEYATIALKELPTNNKV
ncbi:polymeric immunoglobulin receptor-like [Apus apus]|uniref:polymeric immunoglobulin receptor-like n=1 Tax=Apus apus TaxID=8895 RepID=UPI0021F8F889|nr:polymeric immunoglobulin receptor-like [Apus apus]